MAVQYPDVEHQRKKEKRSSGKKQDLERSGSSSKRKRSEDEGDAAAWTLREPTGSDLICQELWSCAPDSTRWTRQAIIFWRFSTTNQWYKYNPVFRPAGTTWRWLTVNDPMSRYHQQRALVYPSAGGNNIPRDAVMSPTPSVSQHLTATMSETFSQAWDNGGSNVTHTQVPVAGGGGSNMTTLFDSFPSGLATPPPTASLHGSYSASGSFDAGNGVGGCYMPTTCGGGADSQPGSLSAPSQNYFDAAGQAVSTTFGDVKPLLSASNTNPYLPGPGGGGTGSLDLSGQFAYDDGQQQHQHHQQPNHSGGSNAGLPGWDMGTTLDSWTAGSSAGGAPAATPTGSDWGPTAPVPRMTEHPGMWDPVHWSHGTPGRGGEGSPRQMKRRRTDVLVDGVPATAGW
jgi:transcriptional enhancer factor